MAKHKCSILGCNLEFSDKEQAMLHAGTSWHCILCGKSDDREVTYENCLDKCAECNAKPPKCQYIRADFKRKVYQVVTGTKPRFVAREYGRWVHYE